MTQGVVDGLEVIQIQGEDRGIPLSLAEQLLEPFQEAPPVVEAGQLVVIGLPTQFRLDPLAVTDVLVAGQHSGHLTGVVPESRG